MAYPSLIQKIMALRKELREANEENTLLCAALAALSEAATRMSGRIAELELEKAEAGIRLKDISRRLASLEQADAVWAGSQAELAGESVRLSGRIAGLEVDGAESRATRAEIADRVVSLEQDSGSFSVSHADLAAQCVRLSSRLTDQELGAEHPNLPPVQAAYAAPEGHELFCGAKVAPVLLVEGGHSSHPSAAFTIVLDNLGNR